MDTTIRIQVYIFLTSIYGGLIAGLAYDIYRVSRFYFKPKKIATLIEDFLFWIGIGFIFFYVLNKNNGIELRGYVFLGFFGGGIIYLKLLSRFLSPGLLKAFGGIIFLYKSIKKYITLPFKKFKKALTPKISKFKKIPKEAISEIRKYKKIISNKK